MGCGDVREKRGWAGKPLAPQHRYQTPPLQLNMSLIFTVTCDHVLYD